MILHTESNISHIAPRSLRVGVSLNKDDIIRINWKLIQAPTVAMKYVVAHEVTYLVHRNHSEDFWLELGKPCPTGETERLHWSSGRPNIERFESHCGLMILKDKDIFTQTAENLSESWCLYAVQTEEKKSKS